MFPCQCNSSELTSAYYSVAARNRVVQIANVPQSYTLEGEVLGYINMPT